LNRRDDWPSIETDPVIGSEARSIATNSWAMEE
jgi:hypothetical protein